MHSDRPRLSQGDRMYCQAVPSCKSYVPENDIEAKKIYCTIAMGYSQPTSWYRGITDTGDCDDNENENEHTTTLVVLVSKPVDLFPLYWNWCVAATTPPLPYQTTPRRMVTIATWPLWTPPCAGLEHGSVLPGRAELLAP